MKIPEGESKETTGNTLATKKSDSQNKMWK